MRVFQSAAAAFALGLSTVSGVAAKDQTFKSDGTSIDVEWFAAGGKAGKQPAILMLHGADGIGERYRIGARVLAASGYNVFLVSYLDRTGGGRADLSALATSYPVWLDTVRDAIGFVASHPSVDPDRIGIVGFSLGASLALVASADDKRVKAVVDFFGPLFRGSEPQGQLPPVLILHGESDRVVPIDNARRIEALLQRRGVEHETKIYPGQGHGFSGTAQLDSVTRAAAFLGRYLGG